MDMEKMKRREKIMACDTEDLAGYKKRKKEEETV